VYTVSGFDPETEGGIYLIELPSDVFQRGFKYPNSWCASRFRPVKTTDISVFRAMLEPSPKQRAEVD
jgi:hypothetical protein